MKGLRYEGSIYRPPSEAKSYLLQCTIGCSHNRCTFCSMYKDKRYRVRPLAEIKADLQIAKAYYGDLLKVFLCDGDALAMDTAELEEIIVDLYRLFPSLQHVGIYASPKSVLRKSAQDLNTLKAAGLTMVYLGVETGDPELLVAIRKGVTQAEMIEAGLKIKAARILLSVTVLLGIAGRTPKAVDHAKNTAKVLNLINPEFIGALTLMIEPKTELYIQHEKGEFILPEPFEILAEMGILIENLEVQGSEFRSNHASNYLPIKGRFPEDKAKVLGLIHQITASKDGQYLRPDYLRGL